MKKTLKIAVVVLVIATVACILFACVPSNLDKAKAKMEKEGYTVIAKELDYEGLVGGFTATKIDLKEGMDTLVAFYFESASAAKNAYDEIKDTASGPVCKGKWIYYGTEDAIDDFED